MTLAISFDDVAAAAQRLAGVAHRTPVMTSRTANALCGGTLFFKCENLQRMGAFKFRGAYNALAQLSDAERRRGVLAYSSGNHAQAIALAGTLLGIRTTIVMPDDAPAVKLAATRGYGGEVITYDKNATTRETLAAALAAERGLTVIPPYDHPHVVAGQGTAAQELIEDAGRLDWLFVCCGGGGLLSGCAIAAAHLSPGCKVVGVEPEAGDDATRSFRTRTL
jgi:threo-3-hydroxy-L-aspartate ammonia-lyase